MTTVAIVYFSATGHTKSMAESLAKGVDSVEDTSAKLYAIADEQFTGGRWTDEATLAEIGSADAIVFGSPTYMGGVAAQLKAFIDAAGSVWFAQGWKNKISGGFTHSGSPSGDKQGTLVYLSVFASQQSMVWISPAQMPNPENGVNRLGSYLGVMGSGSDKTVASGDLIFSELYGQRIAKATHAWNAAQMG
ncbi:MAG: flavodoxin family protein [Cyanobacteria bacterium P01_F01_bin.3]